MTYQVRDWQGHYENDRSRSVNVCSWLRLPNKQDGMGLRRILREPDGAAILGIWALILQKVSQQDQRKCGARSGWLTDDGLPDGRPWTAKDLAELWQRPTEEVQRALEILSVRADWIVVHGAEAQPPPPAPPAAPEQPKLVLEPAEPPKPKSIIAGAADVKEFTTRWNAICPPFSGIHHFGTDRIKKLRARLADPWWRQHYGAALLEMPKRPFLRGENDRGWKAGVDWFLASTKNAAKILEGGYTNSAPKGEDGIDWDAAFGRTKK